MHRGTQRTQPGNTAKGLGELVATNGSFMESVTENGTHGKDSAVNRPGLDVAGSPASVTCSGRACWLGNGDRE